uniref:Uncharacterized protein n=1 Tax=Desulfobacca acetoxidans TaxID=60893 RepID=A0A7C3V6G8_9BACT
MQHLFAIFFRLFFAFLAAKFLARVFGLDNLMVLIGLTLLFLANIYLFDYLDHRSRTSWRRRAQAQPSDPAPEIPLPPPPPE